MQLCEGRDYICGAVRYGANKIKESKTRRCRRGAGYLFCFARVLICELSSSYKNVVIIELCNLICMHMDSLTVRESKSKREREKDRIMNDAALSDFISCNAMLIKDFKYTHTHT